MPFCEIPRENLGHLSLFGFNVTADGDKYLLVEKDGKEQLIKKSKPFVWFDDEDMVDAMQLGACGITIEM